MNLPKAIEILTEDLDRMNPDIDPDEKDALWLAIDTMAAYLNIREDIGQHLAPILQGETP